MVEPAVSVRGLTYRYRGQREPALNGVNLEVAFGPENFQVEREEMARRVKSVLGRVRLEGFERRQPATLSGGQKQRLAIAGIVLGPILLLVLYPRVKRWGLLWTEIMNPEEVSASRFQRLGHLLMWIGGLALGLGLYEQGLAAAGFTAGGAGTVGIGIGLIPFLILIVVASFMLGGREQVEAVQEEVGSGRTE